MTANAREGLYPSSNIYASSEHCWHFSIKEEQSGLAHAAISRNKTSLVRHSVPYYQARQMAKLETSMPGSSTWGFSRPLLPSSSLLGSSRLSSGDCRLGSDYFERGQAS